MNTALKRYGGDKRWENTYLSGNAAPCHQVAKHAGIVCAEHEDILKMVFASMKDVWLEQFERNLAETQTYRVNAELGEPMSA